MDEGLEIGGLFHDDLCSDRNAVIKIGDVSVHQAEAARGDGMADCLWLVGAMDTIDCRQCRARVHPLDYLGCWP